jgi:S-formylglutathione hydrolase FrmB
MALLTCEFFSDSLELSVTMRVILPQPTKTHAHHYPGKTMTPPHPTLYLLHGLGDNSAAWTRQTSLERYVWKKNLAVVMPEVHRSFYADMVRGNRYWTFVSEELPRVCRRFFPLSDRREDNFVAGLSMGGYGAFKLALTHPDRFCAAASLSGALDRTRRMDVSDKMTEEFRNVFGDLSAYPGSGNDLLYLASELAISRKPRPALFQCCGTADFVYPENVAYKDHLNALNIDLTYREHPGREHDWGYWDQTIQDVLEWLPLQTGPAGS